MDFEEGNKEEDYEVAYYIPHRWESLTLKLRKTANAWWMDASKVYRLLDAFDRYNATIEEACSAAGISVKQYKYFAQLHPIINRRRKAARLEKEAEDNMFLASRVMAGDPKACWRWLIKTDPDTFDLRCRGPLARLRRAVGLPAHNPPPKSEEEKLEEMRRNVEKNIKFFEQDQERMCYKEDSEQ